MAEGIQAYVGPQRGGKTLSAVMDCLAHLARGGLVYSNIAGFQDEGCRRQIEKVIRRRYGVIPDLNQQLHFMSWEDVGRWHEIIPNGTTKDGYTGSVLCVLDEVHLFFNSVRRKADLHDVIFRLCQLCKSGISIIFICPSYAQMDVQLRQQVQEIWLHRDLRRLPIPWIGHLGKLMPLPYIRRIQCSPITGLPVDVGEWVTRDPEVLQCYQSFARQSNVTGASFVQVDKLKLQADRKVVKMKRAASIVFILGICGVIAGCRQSQLAEKEARLDALLKKASVTASGPLASGVTRFVVGYCDDGAILSDNSFVRVGDRFGMIFICKAIVKGTGLFCEDDKGQLYQVPEKGKRG